MKVTYDETFYAPGTVVVTGNSGVIATPGSSSVELVVPLWFICLGTDQATDETNDVTIDWYADSAGLYTFGKTTFAQMTAGDMVPPLEHWPGDVTAFDKADAVTAPVVPIPPYCQINWALAGAAKSMSFTLRMTYLVM